MSWEEETLVERLLDLFRARPAGSAKPDSEAQRRRSTRMRDFLTVFGSTHWAERVEGRRIPPARQGHIAL